MSTKKLYSLKITVEENKISMLWLGQGGEFPNDNNGKLDKGTMKLELSVARIIHKVLNKGKKELLEIFEKNDFVLLGEMLFKILISESAVRGFLYQCIAIVMRDQPDARCRIAIEFDDKSYDLAALPWEYLLIQENIEKEIPSFFWAAGQDTPFDLVRYVKPKINPIEQPKISEGQLLNVILIINNPMNNALDDAMAMRSCLSRIKKANPLFNFDDDKTIINPPFFQLKEILARRIEEMSGPYVLHFLGHASMSKDQSGIFFTDKNEQADEIKSIDFVNQLLSSQNSFKKKIPLPTLVILQACESGQVGDKGNGLGFLLAKEGVPAVVAMQNEISEHASENFVREFYLSLLEGSDIASAVTKARSYMALSYNNKNPQDANDHFTDNTFGSPVVFIAAQSPFYLIKSQGETIEATQIKGNSQERPGDEQNASANNFGSSRPTKRIDSNVPRQ